MASPFPNFTTYLLLLFSFSFFFHLSFLSLILYFSLFHLPPAFTSVHLLLPFFQTLPFFSSESSHYLPSLFLPSHLSSFIFVHSSFPHCLSFSFLSCLLLISPLPLHHSLHLHLFLELFLFDSTLPLSLSLFQLSSYFPSLLYSLSSSPAFCAFCYFFIFSTPSLGTHISAFPANIIAFTDVQYRISVSIFSFSRSFPRSLPTHSPNFLILSSLFFPHFLLNPIPVLF